MIRYGTERDGSTRRIKESFGETDLENDRVEAFSLPTSHLLGKMEHNIGPFVRIT